MATRLTLEFADGQSRPDALLALLSDSDRGIVVLAAKTAPAQMDDRSYSLITNTLLHSPDVNVQIAAVDAIGNSLKADRGASLLSVIHNHHTSKDTMFSQASLVKRRAVSRLELSDAQCQALIKQIALDGEEDPTVRADAIRKLTPAAFPEAADALLRLLSTLKDQDAVMLAAIEDNLLAAPNPAIIQALRAKAEALSDPQLRRFMINRLEKSTKGIKQ